MTRILPLCFSAAIVLSGIVQAQAAPAQILAAPAVSSSVISIAACGPGTHLGPYGHYCWANGRAYMGPCPPNYHLGPHGEYCWPNGVSVPAHYSKPCPPNYHLGPEGARCWPN
jgi:hypothetical protein